MGEVQILAPQPTSVAPQRLKPLAFSGFLFFQGPNPPNCPPLVVRVRKGPHLSAYQTLAKYLAVSEPPPQPVAQFRHEKQLRAGMNLRSTTTSRMDQAADAQSRLLGFALWCLSFAFSIGLFAADEKPAAPEGTWEGLNAAKKAFYEMQAPKADTEEFQRFLKEARRQAGELADRFKHYQQHTNGAHADLALEARIELLNIAFPGDPNRKVELEQVEQQGLATRISSVCGEPIEPTDSRSWALAMTATAKVLPAS